VNKVLVVSSPHAYTTRDVWKRVLTGLEANGVDVQPYDLLPRYNMWEFFLEAARKAKFTLPDSFGVNTLACEPVLGATFFYDCDTVLIVSPQYFPMSVVDVLRKAGKTMIAYFTEAPYEDTLNAPIQATHFDYCFVNDRNSVGVFETFCPNTFYLPHSYDPALHFPPADADRDERVLFVGTGYPSRRQFLQKVDWSGIDLELQGLWWLPGRSKLRQFVKGEVMQNEDLADEYRRASVGLSMHRAERFLDASRPIDDGEAYSVGPRTYELAACGILQVSDHRDELVEIFGDAVPVYEKPRDLERILRRALDDPAWRDELAERQLAAIQGHSCEVRMQTILEAVA